MIFENFGIFVSDVIKDEELTDKQKESVISFKLENMKTPSTSLIDALSDLDELDYGTYVNCRHICSVIVLENILKDHLTNLVVFIT
jgi:hypothetical protein